MRNLKIIDWDVVTAKNWAYLHEGVAHNLEKGWEPYGQVFFDEKLDRRYCLAMVKYEEPPKQMEDGLLRAADD